MDYTTRKVNVLGTEYRIEFRDEKEDNLLEDRYGYMDETDGLIAIKKVPENNEFKNPDERIKETIRHEITHAFLIESGLSGSSFDVTTWATNEEMVDWIARQMPKMVKAMQDAGAM